MKISFCTTCMDRCFHLKELYVQSIKNASTYNNVEFILLNYNSKDDLEDWVVDNLGEYICNGILKYYKTIEPIYFQASHAKNIAHKLATGDLLCNLDSDNLIVSDFCEHISLIFKNNSNVIVCSDNPEGYYGCDGKIICKKQDFHSVNGYDENIYLGWGMDHINFQYRCGLHNDLEVVKIIDQKWNYCINHSNYLRSKNFQLKDFNLSMSMSVRITQESCNSKNFIANKGFHWGKANLIENFHKEIFI